VTANEIGKNFLQRIKLEINFSEFANYKDLVEGFPTVLLFKNICHKMKG